MLFCLGSARIPQGSRKRSRKHNPNDHLVTEYAAPVIHIYIYIHIYTYTHIFVRCPLLSPLVCSRAIHYHNCTHADRVRYAHAYTHVTKLIATWLSTTSVGSCSGIKRLNLIDSAGPHTACSPLERDGVHSHSSLRVGCARR